MHSWSCTKCYFTDDRRVRAFHQLTLLHARRYGNEGHEAAEPQVDPQQGLVELAGDGMRVVLVHEGEGHGGDRVEEEGSAHHGQVPALVLCCSGQPEGKSLSFTPVPLRYELWKVYESSCFYQCFTSQI